MSGLTLKVLPEVFSVCQLASPTVACTEPYCFAAKTADEVSLVCPTKLVPPETVRREDGWRAFFVDGMLDFSLVGILAQIAEVLARENIAIFAVSTYHTDYIFTKADVFGRALSALADAGFAVIDPKEEAECSVN